MTKMTAGALRTRCSFTSVTLPPGLAAAWASVAEGTKNGDSFDLDDEGVGYYGVR